jgi:hypothetical protein
MTTTTSDRVDELRAELRSRLKGICSDMPAENFEALIQQMAELQDRSERRAIDPESWVGTSRRFQAHS